MAELTVEQLKAQMEVNDQEFMIAQEAGDDARASELVQEMWRIQWELDALQAATPRQEPPRQGMRP